MLFSFLFICFCAADLPGLYVHVVCEAHCADGRRCTVQGAFIIDNHAVFLVLFCILMMLQDLAFFKTFFFFFNFPDCCSMCTCSM